MKKAKSNKSSFFVFSIYNNVINNTLTIPSFFNKCKKGFSFDLWFYMENGDCILFLQDGGMKLHVYNNYLKFCHPNVDFLFEDDIKIKNKVWYNIFLSCSNSRLSLFLNGNMILFKKELKNHILLNSDMTIGQDVYIRTFRLYNCII